VSENSGLNLNIATLAMTVLVEAIMLKSQRYHLMARWVRSSLEYFVQGWRTLRGMTRSRHYPRQI